MTWILLALVLCSLVLAARLERPGIITLVAIVLLAVHMIRVLHRGDWFAVAVTCVWLLLLQVSSMFLEEG